MRSLSGEEQTSGLTAENVAFDRADIGGRESQLRKIITRPAMGMRLVGKIAIIRSKFGISYRALPNKSGAPGTS
jgi:hypothetical protein